MRIAIIGAGAMGTLFGGFLSQAAEVYLIRRSEEHVRAIRENGLIIEKNDGSAQTFHPFATIIPKDIAIGIDLALIFTKSYDTETAAHIAKSLLRQDGIALTLQNGVGNLDIIEKIVGRGRAVAGVTSHGATMLAPGRVRHAGIGTTTIAMLPGKERLLNEIAKTFESAGIAVSLTENADNLIWGKLIINVGINALTAILRVQNGVLGITPQCEKIMACAVEEAVAVANASGIVIPYPSPLEQVKKVCAATAQNRASMLQDILNSRQTEISAINQAIVRKGQESGIPTPCNRFLSDIIEALEATSEHRIR
ncbi:MAG TPA: 2-dehydropantoate 2-reductase [Desulfobacteraceae bacterium]|nr:2-dehydropantoate 2-reductase [Desulfobacteraceae bacterium]